MLTESDKSRYARQISIPEFGVAAQEKLNGSSVLVVGAGGLGCPALLYLTSCGAGKIGIADHDIVSESNLQRQVLFDQQDIGRHKAEVAAERLSAINPRLNLETIAAPIKQQNVLRYINDYDIILDCTDNFETRYLINDACVIAGKCCVSASLFRFQGQIYVLNADLNLGKRSCDYREIYPQNNTADYAVNCSTSGVLGSVAGIIGTIQATEAIKVLTGIGQPLTNRIMYIDARTMETMIMDVEPETKAAGSFPVNEEELLSWNYNNHTSDISDILKADEMNQLLSEGDVLVIDVRELHESPDLNLKGSVRIPLSELSHEHELLKGVRRTICVCQSGKRSRIATKILNNAGIRSYSFEKGVIDWNSFCEKCMTT
jgi:adenylyltransferase/sulfurtransferase